MSKSRSTEETAEQVNGKKRRSRRKSGLPTAAVDETRKELEEQLHQLHSMIGAQEQERKAVDDDSNTTRDEAYDAELARKQVEAQRQRLEEALVLAKERKRAEELTVQAPPGNRGNDAVTDSEESVVAGGSQLEDQENSMPDANSELSIKTIETVGTEKAIEPIRENDDLMGHVVERLNSKNPENRARALNELSKFAREQAFAIISKAFDDPSPDVRNAAAKALYSFESDPTSTFARALREAPPERRRQIGSSLAASGIASDALGNLAGCSREKTHEALALLFLMAKAGEVRPLMTTIEEGQNQEVSLAVVNLLALSGRSEIVPTFRRLTVRGSLPAQVRSAVMEAIYQISSQKRETVSR